MRAFKQGQLVVVTDKESPLFEKRGKVVRIRISDNGAWVDMEEDLPFDLRSFPEDDPRANHTIVYPDQCKGVEP